MYRPDFETLNRIHRELLQILCTNKSLSTLEVDALSDAIGMLENVFGIE